MQADRSALEEGRSAAVAKACRLIEQAEDEPSLADLADHAGMSRYHFHRVFKAHTGVTPKAYAMAQSNPTRTGRSYQNRVGYGAIYAAGYNSGGRFYSSATRAASE